MKTYIKKIFSLLLVVIMITTLIACGEAEEDISIKGWIGADSMISGSKITFYNRNNKVMFDGQSFTSDEFGRIEVNVRGKYKPNFYVIAEGGTLDGEEIKGKLRADYRDFDQEKDVLYINFATTIVGSYMEKHDDKNLDDATASVKNFLEIPESFDIYAEAMKSTSSFDNYKFMIEAAESDGIDTFTDNLITELDTNMSNHPFKSNSLHGGKAFAFWAAQSLATGAVGYLGGELLGWGLDSLGWNIGGDVEGDRHKEIMAGIEDMKNQLSDISLQLDVVSSKLDQISEKLDNMYTKLSLQMTKLEYSNKVSNLMGLIESVKSIQNDLIYEVTSAPVDVSKYNEKELAKMEVAMMNNKKDLLDRIKNKIIDNNIIPYELTGVLGETGLMELWKTIVYSNRFISSRDYDNLVANFEYFGRLQESILLLKVEYYHATETYEGQNKDRVLALIDEFNEAITLQESFLPTPILEGTIIDTEYNRMFYSNILSLNERSLRDIRLVVDYDEIISMGKPRFVYIYDLPRAVGFFDNLDLYGYSDWKLINNEIFMTLHENKNDKIKMSDRLISQGWPGKTVDKIFVPFYSYKNDYALGYVSVSNSGATSLILAKYSSDQYEIEYDPSDTFVLSLAYHDNISPIEFGYSVK